MSMNRNLWNQKRTSLMMKPTKQMTKQKYQMISLVYFGDSFVAKSALNASIINICRLTMRSSTNKADDTEC